MTFWCEGTVAPEQAEELRLLENKLIALRDRVSRAIGYLDAADAARLREQLRALESVNLEVRKLPGEERLRGTREVIARLESLMREVSAASAILSRP
jgi:hypothetical protein